MIFLNKEDLQHLPIFLKSNPAPHGFFIIICLSFSLWAYGPILYGWNSTIICCPYATYRAPCRLKKTHSRFCVKAFCCNYFFSQLYLFVTELWIVKHNIAQHLIKLWAQHIAAQLIIAQLIIAQLIITQPITAQFILHNASLQNISLQNTSLHNTKHRKKLKHLLLKIS